MRTAQEETRSFFLSYDLSCVSSFFFRPFLFSFFFSFLSFFHSFLLPVGGVGSRGSESRSTSDDSAGGKEMGRRPWISRPTRRLSPSMVLGESNNRTSSLFSVHLDTSSLASHLSLSLCISIIFSIPMHAPRPSGMYPCVCLSIYLSICV